MPIMPFSILNKKNALLLAGILLSSIIFAQSFTTQSLDKASASKQAQQKVQGQVLKVEQNANKYRVKILQKSGRVVSVDVDKRSGKVTPIGAYDKEK